ncbi:MAG: hypothetical protein CM1200mP36_01980 [Gammaproteobacteria bacterium]|nr:MAG: hypothetical protein CM1200mP36_01980 [Gammaproteobacteria bacterium]
MAAGLTLDRNGSISLETPWSLWAGSDSAPSTLLNVFLPTASSMRVTLR